MVERRAKIAKTPNPPIRGCVESSLFRIALKIASSVECFLQPNCLMAGCWLGLLTIHPTNSIFRFRGLGKRRRRLVVLPKIPFIPEAKAADESERPFPVGPKFYTRTQTHIYTRATANIKMLSMFLATPEWNPKQTREWVLASWSASPVHVCSRGTLASAFLSGISWKFLRNMTNIETPPQQQKQQQMLSCWWSGKRGWVG